MGVHQEHRIPLSKILHTLGRKSFLETVLWEKGAHNDEYAAECAFYGQPCTGVDRLHFSSARLNTIDDLKQYPSSYGGYCDLRPDTRTVVSANITQDAVIRRDRETYAFLCCSMPRSVLIVDEKGGEVLRPQVVTMPFVQKDNRAVMCAQAALMMLGEYWNYRRAGTFKSRTAVEINRMAGVPDAEALPPDAGRGLLPQEIVDYLVAEKVPFMPLAYDDQAKKKADVDIYGFIESGFPVVVAVQTRTAAHALICLGHTYDRNSWSAMAEVGYFDDWGAGNGRYHSNTAWIRNYLVHDDNLGPYYFLPAEKLKDTLIFGFVVLPDASITTLPSEAADAAYTMLNGGDFLAHLPELLKLDEFSSQNKFWLEVFISHLTVGCGDGLVLRSVLLPGARILGMYSEHEFAEAVSAVLENSADHHYWYVELSWPDIYCHRQLCCGSVILSATTKKTLFIHVPGLCIAWPEGDPDPTILLAKSEDAPWTHYKRVVPA